MSTTTKELLTLVNNGQKMTKRARQAIETRNRIYESANRILQRHGFDNMTVEMISKEAEISVGAFYHHFKSKYEILNEVFIRADDYFFDHVFNQLEGHSTPIKIIKFFEHYARFIFGQGLDHIRALYKTQSRIFVDSRRLMVTGLQNIIEQGIDDKEIMKNGMDSQELTEFLFSVARGATYNWCLLGEEFPLVEKMNRYITRVVQSFTP